MTIIAWDGKALAADRRRTVNDTPMQVTKVKKLRDGERDFLLGCAGNSFECTQFIETFKFGDWERIKPTNFAALIIADDGLIWYMEDKPLVHQISMPFFAIGSGSQFAMGAMAAGACAAEAVRIASRLDIHCGDGVDEVAFGPSRFA